MNPLGAQSKHKERFESFVRNTVELISNPATEFLRFSTLPPILLQVARMSSHP